MNKNKKSLSWAVIFVFIFLVFASSAPAQKLISIPCIDSEDIPVVFPFDFNDKYYSNRGVVSSEIIGRRTGDDGLSVIDKICNSNSNVSNVRVTATVPAYDQNGEPLFWYPLGDLQANGFTPDKIGHRARQTAGQYPIYVFPDRSVTDFSAFANLRQAPVMDNSRAPFSRVDANPLGLREIFVVNYTEKAFGKEGFEMMAFFGKKNGLAADDTPIIKSLDDITFLMKNDFVTVESFVKSGLLPSIAQYAISPMITKKGAIAQDAFLWMASKGGTPLVAEEIFVYQFNCLKKTGEWCK